MTDTTDGKDIQHIMRNVSELQQQMSVVVSKVTEMAAATKEIAQLDRTLVGITAHTETASKQLALLWERLDDLNTWRQRLPGDTSEHLQKVMQYADAGIAVAQKKADEAAAGVNSINDRAHGFMKALGYTGAVAGCMLTAGAIWMVSTVVESKQRLAIIEYNQAQVHKP